MKLAGVFAPVATPFDHNGALYRAKVEHNLDKLNRVKLAGYILASHWGEGRLLLAEEKLQLWEYAKQWAAEDRILIADVSSESVRESEQLAAKAAALGYAFVIATCPTACRYDASWEGTQLLYLRSIADRSPVPVIVWNDPAALTVALEPDVLAGAALHPNVSAVATPNVEALAGKLRPGVTLLGSGSGSFHAALEKGAAGAITPFANCAPYTLITIWEAFRTREFEAAADWQSRIAPACALIEERHGVPLLKSAMDWNDYYGGPPRLPRAVVCNTFRQQITQAMEGLRG